MVNSGQLDRKITIETFTEARNSVGEPIKTWATFLTTMAKVTHKSGREFFSAGQDVAETDTLFKIRHRTGITREMRILYQSNYYDIQEINPGATRREYLEIMAQAQRVD